MCDRSAGGIYSLADCARLLREPRETVREWTLKGLVPGRQVGQRVSPFAYDFVDLVSLLVVSRLRQRGIPLQRIRRLSVKHVLHSVEWEEHLAESRAKPAA